MTLRHHPRYDSHPELPGNPDVLQPRNSEQPPHLTAKLQAIVFLGGCFGTFARYEASVKLPTLPGTWPTATFTVNIIGAFLLGLLLEALARRGIDTGARHLARFALGTGFLGAFTTYSSFALDANLLARHGNVVLAIVYIAASIVCGVLLCMAGIRLASKRRASRSGKR